ncbi:hypothetical protein B0H19DRAFT_1060446 [Mycena capillaripes]|nr:hypothetical protein B0H19DRAFT_1060446 [Mycena capillaripes]
MSLIGHRLYRICKYLPPAKATALDPPYRSQATDDGTSPHQPPRKQGPPHRKALLARKRKPAKKRNREGNLTIIPRSRASSRHALAPLDHCLLHRCRARGFDDKGQDEKKGKKKCKGITGKKGERWKKKGWRPGGKNAQAGDARQGGTRRQRGRGCNEARNEATLHRTRRPVTGRVKMEDGRRRGQRGSVDGPDEGTQARGKEKGGKGR